MTKFLTIAYCLIISCFIHLKAQQADNSDYISSEELLIEPLFESYYTNDTVYLVVKNLSEKHVFYAISLEEEIGKRWIPIVRDIYRNNNELHNARNIKTLVEKQQSIYAIAVTDLLKTSSLPQGLCRFCINAKETPLERKGVKIYSASFVILPENDREFDQGN